MALAAPVKNAWASVAPGPWEARCPPAHWFAGRLALLAATLALVSPLGAQRTREYDLKAVFLFNFAMFVEWPDEPGPASEEAFVIGILGDDPFGAVLEQVIAGETVKGAPLVVRRFRSVEEAKQARILYISAPPQRMPEILAGLRDLPILTVSDGPQFLAAGGIVGFSTGARVELHINAEAARRAKLTISSKLLRVAKLYGGGPSQ